MGQDYSVISVTGAKEWKGQHGRFIDYFCDLEGESEQVTVTQKEETPAVEPGDTLYGHIEVQQRTKRDGTPFTVHKFKKEQREDSGGRQQPQAASAPPRSSSAGSVNKPDAEFWSQKDRRIARAGMLQAVVQAHPFPSGHPNLREWLVAANEMTDALLASLDERTPHPSSDHHGAGLSAGRVTSERPVQGPAAESPSSGGRSEVSSPSSPPHSTEPAVSPPPQAPPSSPVVLDYSGDPGPDDLGVGALDDSYGPPF